MLIEKSWQGWWAGSAKPEVYQRINIFVYKCTSATVRSVDTTGVSYILLKEMIASSFGLLAIKGLWYICYRTSEPLLFLCQT